MPHSMLCTKTYGTVSNSSTQCNLVTFVIKPQYSNQNMLKFLDTTQKHCKTKQKKTLSVFPCCMFNTDTHIPVSRHEQHLDCLESSTWAQLSRIIFQLCENPQASEPKRLPLQILAFHSSSLAPKKSQGGRKRPARWHKRSSRLTHSSVRSRAGKETAPRRKMCLELASATGASSLEAGSTPLTKRGEAP